MKGPTIKQLCEILSSPRFKPNMVVIRLEVKATPNNSLLISGNLYDPDTNEIVYDERKIRVDEEKT